MDNLTASQRSKTMRAVKGTNTSAEIAVRRLCRDMGEPGYRLHRPDLPGKPDLAYVGRGLAVFVHGCFWHGHDCAAGAKSPRTNSAYWLNKITRNRARDTRNLEALLALGWRTLVVWECELKSGAATKKLRRFLRR